MDKKLIRLSYFLFLILFDVILVLHFNHAYYDIMDAKAKLFVLFMRVFVWIALLIVGYKIYKRSLKPDLFCLSLFLMVASAFLSFIFSYSREDAFYGTQGWNVGFFAILSLIICILAFRDDVHLDKKYYFPLAMICLFEYFLTICDAFDLDLLSMKDSLELPTHYAYFATIGNSNWYVGFLALTVPFFMSMYFGSEKKSDIVLYFLLSLCGMLSCLVINTNGIFLSLAVSIFAMIPLITKRSSGIRRFAFLLAFLTMILLMMSSSPGMYYFFYFYDSVGKYLFDQRVCACLFLLAFVLTYRIDDNWYENKQKGIEVFAKCIFLLALIGPAVYILIGNGKGMDNYRIELWRTSFDQFKRFDLYQKLFGLGEELQRNIYSSISTKYGILFTVSHSEPVQALVSMGCLGLFSWMMCWISIFVSFFQRKDHDDPLQIGLYAGLFGYFVQSFVNSATIPNLCVLSIFLIMLKKEYITK